MHSTNPRVWFDSGLKSSIGGTFVGLESAGLATDRCTVRVVVVLRSGLIFLQSIRKRVERLETLEVCGLE